MKILYTSGKYRDQRGPWYVKENIETAEKIALELWKVGFAVICPHKNTAFFEGPLEDKIILDGDCEMVARCDGLVVLPNWRTSEGTHIEANTALRARVPLFFWELEHRAILRHWVSTGEAGLSEVDAMIRHQSHFIDLPDYAKELGILKVAA